jgi:hypothetical protein
VDVAMEVCLLLDQDTADPFSRNTNPVVDYLLSRSPAKSASTKHTSSF